MTEVFNPSRKRVAILENAYGVVETQKMNALWSLSFTLPYQDPKNQYCNPFWYVRHDGGELYRIMPDTVEIEETGGITYQCEHVLATLIDNVLYGYHVVGNLGTYTADCINYVLEHQITKNWVLDTCDFTNQFEYGWEQESLLSALFSIATPLSGPYMWVTDTSVYPWRLSLKRLQSGIPELYIRRRHNMTTFSRNRDALNIATRIYPLGYGEGVNQLDITGVNNGIPYLQSPQSIIDKYGIIERVWVDRRYEDAESLKAAAQNMLDELQSPTLEYTIGFQELTTADWDKAEIGKRARIIFPEIGEQVDTYVTELTRNYDDPASSQIVIANRSTDIASTVADMADRQRIEQTYAQGATQLYSQTIQANCDKDSGAVMDFFIPSEMRIINKVLCKVRMGPFRAYSKATNSQQGYSVTSAGGGASTITSSSGGSSTVTSASGGSSSVTSEGGGGSTTDTGEGGINVTYGNLQTEESNGHTHTYSRVTSHQHKVTLSSHTHTVKIGSHNHSVAIGSHTHSVEIKSHTHSITIPSHSHEITPGIFTFGNPQSFSLFINGVQKASFQGTMTELDITQYLVGNDNMIPRGTWLSLEIRPNDLAYVSIDLIVQGFVQSRGDNTV